MRSLFFLVLVFALPAFAEQDLMTTAFEDGQYLKAATEAEAVETPDSLAFAARCLLAEAMSASDYKPPESLILEAETMARQALEIEAQHVEGRLQLAIALSLRARPLSTREAMRSGYGDEAKALVEAVLEDDPQNFYANGFMAVWHVEVVRRGGSIGSAVMGASVKKGRTHYEAAIDLESDDASTHWQYARALSALNARKYRDEIDLALNEAINASADTALERVMQARAEKLQAALKTQKRRDVEKLAAKML